MKIDEKEILKSWQKTDFAYLAGLIDGDGSLLIRRRDKNKTAGDRARGISFQARISIGGETNHITKLRNKIGFGVLFIRKREGQRHLAELILADGKAIVILKKIEPYLMLKKKQANVIIKMPRPKTRWGVTQKLREKQEACRKEIMQLNQLGRGRKTK